MTDLEQWPDSIQALSASLGILRDALRILGMRDRILLGDTVGAMALVDSARSQPLMAPGRP